MIKTKLQSYKMLKSPDLTQFYLKVMNYLMLQIKIHCFYLFMGCPNAWL